VKRCFLLIGLVSAGCSVETSVPPAQPIVAPLDSAEDGLIVKQVVLKLPGMV
jgi:hypothetical protein